MGCTTWEVVSKVVLPYTRVGVIGGIMLGLGRALGETMAVTFVIGNAHRISASILAPGTTISATIANEFTEAVGDLYTSSLIALGLILFVITFIVLARPATCCCGMERASRGLKPMSLYAGRRRRNAIAMGSRCSATAFGLLWLVLILASAALEGLRRPVAGGLHRDDAAARQRRRPAQRHRRQPDLTVIGVAIGTPLGILAGTYMAEYGRFSKLTRSSASSTTSCSPRPRSSSACSSTRSWSCAWATSRPGPAASRWRCWSCRWWCAPPRTCCSWCRTRSAKRPRAGHAALDGHPQRHLPRGARRHRHRRAARDGAHQRRDGAAPVHRAQQPVLEPRTSTRRWRACRSTIFQFALSPYEDWQQLAWTGALIITVAVLALNIVARAPLQIEDSQCT